jgi:hypothetical protein
MNSVVSFADMRLDIAGDEAKEAMRKILKNWKDDRRMAATSKDQEDYFRALDEIVDKFEAIDYGRTTFNDFKHDLIDLDAFLNK